MFNLSSVVCSAFLKRFHLSLRFKSRWRRLKQRSAIARKLSPSESNRTFFCVFIGSFQSPFSLVSIAVWIYFNRFQNTGALGVIQLNYFVLWNFYLLAPFLYPWVALKGPFFRKAKFGAGLLLEAIQNWYISLTLKPWKWFMESFHPSKPG